ncbi:hypothetical protein AX15_000835 [Amanita polypyramis BW_CC]|nr:hypothetical protein AX15_000835 [Amanita polypyramis BW_CC]
MSVTQSIAIPSSPSAGNSPRSEEPNSPHTPASPAMSQPEQNMQQLMSKSPSPFPQIQQQQSNSNNTNDSANTSGGQAKRKPSRRANTAERRATHNAVERQRRETLNGRFLDLAALLPNLSQIRRPSKSSIVNSSIAHILASRRHRILAARELRLLKLETDVLRRQLNEWHDRAGIPYVEEPVRSEAFSMVLSGELEVLASVPGEEEDDEMSYGGYDGEDDNHALNGQFVPPGILNGGLDDLEDPRLAMSKNPAAFPHGVPTQHAHHGSGNSLHLAHIMPRPAVQGAGPMIATPAAVVFDNPAMPLYDLHAYPEASFIQPQQSHPTHAHQLLDSEKVAAWNATQMHQMIHPQRAIFTPPASHPMSSGSPGHSSTTESTSPSPHSTSSPVGIHPGAPFGEAGFYSLTGPQPQMLGHSTYTERDDASSVTSNRSLGDCDILMEHKPQFRETPSVAPAVSSVRHRSGSMNIVPVHSSAGSPGVPSYDMGSSAHGDFSVNMQRRATHSGGWVRNDDIAGGMNIGMGVGVGVGMNPVAVGGGGGNGTGFMMMM